MLQECLAAGQNIATHWDRIYFTKKNETTWKIDDDHGSFTNRPKAGEGEIENTYAYKYFFGGGALVQLNRCFKYLKQR